MKENYGYANLYHNQKNEKGHVERSVEYVRRKALSKQDEFTSLEKANQYLEKELLKINLRKVKYYDTARTCELRVNKYSVVSVDENKYSVPDKLVGKFVFSKIYPTEILIYLNNQFTINVI